MHRGRGVVFAWLVPTICVYRCQPAGVNAQGERGCFCLACCLRFPPAEVNAQPGRGLFLPGLYLKCRKRRNVGGLYKVLSRLETWQ